MTDPAFYDASALVPFCLYEATSQRVRAYLRQHAPVVWWASRIEICSAVARLLRFGDIDAKEADRALGHLETMSRVWSEIRPDESVRDMACQLVTMYPLRDGDSLQLAAALTWCQQRPRGRTFICGDQRLGNAAKTVGFSVIDL